ncbi:MAG: PfkB family carbohydrate kinase [Planctomycetota bacterium]
MQSQFPDARLIVLDTIDLYVREYRPKLLEAIAGAHGLVINDWEATQLTGEGDATEAAQKLLGLGPRFAIVKRGDHGAVLAHPEAMWHCPAYPVKDLVDPTGAGDSFLGGFLGYMAEHNADADHFAAIQQAMCHGTAAASFTIEDFSPRRLAKVTRKQIDERVAELDC